MGGRLLNLEGASVKTLFTVLALFMVFTLYLQYRLSQATERLKTLEIERSAHYATKIAKVIKQQVGTRAADDIRLLAPLGESLSRLLESYKTKEYRYAYLLTRDRKGRFRFVADATESGYSRVDTLQPFFPGDTIFARTYRSGKAIVANVKNQNGEIWRSLLFPIKDSSGKTQMMLVLELSGAYVDTLQSILYPLDWLMKIMRFFLVFAILFLIFVIWNIKKVRDRVYKDPLTGLYTIKYIQHHDHLIEHKKKQMALMVVLKNYRFFKENDTQQRADKLLRSFAKHLKEVLPKDCTIARTVGAEFFVLLGKMEEKTVPEERLKALYESIASFSYYREGEKILTEVLVSAAVFDGEKKEFLKIDNLQKLLDERILELHAYKAKKHYCLVQQDAVDALKFKNFEYIRKALEEKRFLCLYQPIFHTMERRIVKFEALVRLRDDKDPKKLVTPYHFMDTIKGTSQYAKMTEQVLEYVFQTIEKYPQVHISVNLDLSDLVNKEVTDTIERFLESHRQIAEQLTFEILEDRQIQDFDEVAKKLATLKKYGSQIALDDFGSGYANYTYLIKLDWDVLKIDGSIIRELKEHKKKAKNVLHSISQIASKANYKLVAEFVEDEEIYKDLVDLQIEYSQGYFLGRPGPIDAFMGKEEEEAA